MTDSPLPFSSPAGPAGPAGSAGSPGAGPGPDGPAGPAGSVPGTEPRPRRRDRHGRGMRGPVAPPQVPLSASRAELFGDLVRDSVERLERRWPQLAEVEFVVADVPGPPGGPDGGWNDEAVPLGGLVEAAGGRPARIVVFRRPVDIRTKTRDEKALLVHEIVVEQVAELLGLSPETVDPRYGQD
ncbi:metallopeptidase family protein [Streptomyces goshikiensis]|uniref:metallopeptidase family protein n=1 Tax=Streptomyces goshikiensis TaxID=1942 RepID=UPI003661C32D